MQCRRTITAGGSRPLTFSMGPLDLQERGIKPGHRCDLTEMAGRNWLCRRQVCDSFARGSENFIWTSSGLFLWTEMADSASLWMGTVSVAEWAVAGSIG